MTAEIYVPIDKQGWWGGPDTRPRCAADNKVVFRTAEAARASTAKATTPMKHYLGKCGHWHTARKKKK